VFLKFYHSAKEKAMYIKWQSPLLACNNIMLPDWKNAEKKGLNLKKAEIQEKLSGIIVTKL